MLLESTKDPICGYFTNTEMLERVGQEQMLLGRVKSRKLKYFNHVARIQSLEHGLMFGSIQGEEGKEDKVRQWFDDVTQWIGKDLPTCYQLAEGSDPFRHLIHRVAYAQRKTCRVYKMVAN